MFHKPPSSDNRIITKDEVSGWLSIIALYLAVGFLMALPFLVLKDKTLAWFISNLAGIAWLFWYGVQLGKSAGKYQLTSWIHHRSCWRILSVGSYMTMGKSLNIILQPLATFKKSLKY